MENQNKVVKILLSLLIFLSILALGATSFVLIKTQYKPILPTLTPMPVLSPIPKKIGFKKFSSEKEFVAYLKTAARVLEGLPRVAPAPLREALEAPRMRVPEAGGAVPERVSETTVQVRGIDEPDIVKTDGREIYFSSALPTFRPLGRELSSVGERIMSPPRGGTKVIKAFPPADLAKEAQIEKAGNLLLDRDILVVFANDSRIYGYDVSNPRFPTEEWKIELEKNNLLVDARFYQDKVYFVTQTRIDTIKPCPVVPLSLRGIQFSIRCTDIYHPTVNVPADVTYTVFILEPTTGKINKSVSFVGPSGSSVIYMSKRALYATYTYYEDWVAFFYNFFLEKGQDLVSASMIERLKSLRGYEISNQAKMVEFQNILKQHLDSLSDDERLRVENEFANRMMNYSREHTREWERTGVVKIALDNLEVLATGNIPGRLLNQFSLDEYQNYLRIATTVGERMSGARESANDVYVLDSNLKQVGSVVDLGLGERVYSVRFIEDKGYLVTFRQTDPFFVLDLSDPRRPEVKGKLKIPGYSSYLHPITKDKILGVGKEGSQVKLSLFDVVSAENPTEISKYLLDEFWSDILNTHHAFLLDKKHNVFFLPGSKGGYVFSYQGNELRLTRAVTNIRARRAIYINDYMYIIGNNKLIVLDEINWGQVNQLEF